MMTIILPKNGKFALALVDVTGTTQLGLAQGDLQGQLVREESRPNALSIVHSNTRYNLCHPKACSKIISVACHGCESDIKEMSLLAKT